MSHDHRHVDDPAFAGVPITDRPNAAARNTCLRSTRCYPCARTRLAGYPGNSSGHASPGCDNCDVGILIRRYLAPESTVIRKEERESYAFAMDSHIRKWYCCSTAPGTSIGPGKTTRAWTGTTKASAQRNTYGWSLYNRTNSLPKPPPPPPPTPH